MKGMQKIRRVVGYLGLLLYLDEAGKCQIIGGNMCGQNAQELAREFGIARRLKPGNKKPGWHNSLRLPAGEHLDPEKWVEVCDEYMRRMGFQDDHQRAYFLEDHEDGQHVHIVASRISLSGRLYLGKNENLESTKIIGELEAEFDLQRTKQRDDLAPAKRRDIAKPKPSEINKGVREGQQPARLRLQTIVADALTNRPTLSDFFTRIESAGARILAAVSPSTGRVSGLSFGLDSVVFKASDLGKKYSWNSLLKGLDYDQIADAGVIASRAVRHTTGGNSEQTGADRDRAPGVASTTGTGDGGDGGRAPDAVEGVGGPSGPDLEADERKRTGMDGGGDEGGNGDFDALESGNTGGKDHGAGEKSRGRDAPGALAVGSGNGLGSVRSADHGVKMSDAMDTKLWDFDMMHAGLYKPAHYRLTATDSSKKTANKIDSVSGKSLDRTHNLGDAINPEEVRKMIESGMLDRLVARKFDINIKPLDPQFHYIAVHDIRGRDGLAAFKAEGYKPVLVQETAGKFQAVLIVEQSREDQDHAFVDRAATAINRKHGNPAVIAAGGQFRLPGFGATVVWSECESGICPRSTKDRDNRIYEAAREATANTPTAPAPAPVAPAPAPVAKAPASWGTPKFG